MKLRKVTLIIFLFIFQINALYQKNIYSSNLNKKMPKWIENQDPVISVKIGKNESFKEFFSRLQEKTGIYFLLSDEITGNIDKDINIKNERLRSILDEILIHKGYYYFVIGKSEAKKFGDYKNGYYIAIPKRKYLNIDTNENIKRELFKEEKTGALKNEYNKKYYLKHLREKINRSMKTTPKTKEEVLTEQNRRDNELRKKGLLLEIKPKYLYSFDKEVEEIEKIGLKQVKKTNNKKLVKTLKSKGGCLTINANNNSLFEVSDMIKKSAEVMKFKSIKIYKEDGSFIEEKVDNGFIRISLNCENFIISKNLNPGFNEGRQVEIRNKNNETIFSKVYDSNYGYNYSILDTYGFLESGSFSYNFYDKSGRKTINLTSDNGVMSIDISKNGKNILIIEGFKKITKYDYTGNIVNTKYLPKELNTQHGIVSDNGDIYFAINSYNNEKTGFESSLFSYNSENKLIWQFNNIECSYRFDLINNDKYILAFDRKGILYLIDSLNGKMLCEKYVRHEFLKDEVSIYGKFINGNRILYNDKFIFLPCIKNLYVQGLDSIGRTNVPARYKSSFMKNSVIYIFDYKLNFIDKIKFDDFQNDKIVYGIKLINNELYIMTSDGIMKYEF